MEISPIKLFSVSLNLQEALIRSTTRLKSDDIGTCYENNIALNR